MKLIELLNEILEQIKKYYKETKSTKYTLTYKGEDFLEYSMDEDGYMILFLQHNSDFNIILWKDKGEPFCLKYNGEYYNEEQEIINILLKEIPYFNKYNRKQKLIKLNESMG